MDISPNIIESSLESALIDFDKNGKEVLISCPFCNHHKRKLSIDSKTGAFKCWVCLEVGHWAALIRTLGIDNNSVRSYNSCNSNKPLNSKTIKSMDKPYESNIPDDALGYLISRSINDPAVISQSRADFNTEKNAFILPLTNPDTGDIEGKKLKFIKTAAQTKLKKPYEIIGKSLGIYIINQSQYLSAKNCIVVEGEIDALSVYQYLVKAQMLKEWTVLSSTGMTNRGCVYYLNHFENVYIWFDNESDRKARELVNQAQQALSKEIIGKHPHIKLFNINGPENVKDANDYLKLGYPVESFKSMISNSSEYLEGRISRKVDYYFKSSMDYLKDPLRCIGVPTLYDNMDNLFGGGKRPGELTLWHAEAKTGKNTLWHAMMYRWLKAGIACGYASREIGPHDEVIPNLLSLEFKMNMWKAQQEGKLTDQIIDNAERIITEWPLYFADGYGTFELTDLIKWVNELKAKGVKFFFIDHLHYCLVDSESPKEASSFIRRLKQLCNEEDIHIDLIVQPKYIGPDQRLGLNSLRGGASIGQAGSNLIILNRVKNADGSKCKNMMEVKMEAARSKVAKTGEKAFFQYNPETTELTPVDKLPQSTQSSPHKPYSKNPKPLDEIYNKNQVIVTHTPDDVPF